MLKHQRIMVTGASSMLGRPTVELLKAEGAIVKEVFHIDYDLTSQSECTRLFNDFPNPTFLLHFAGFNGGINYNKKLPATIFERTVKMGVNVLAMAASHKVKKVINLMTSCAYPPTEEPLKEEQFLTSDPHPSVRCHALAKRTLYIFSQLLEQQYGMRTVSVILNNSFGPCFDSQTEILTVNGKKNIKDINIGEKVYSLNPKTLILEIATVIEKQHYKTNKWISLKNHGVDIKVTPEHILFIQNRVGSPIRRIQAKDLENKIGKQYGQFNLLWHKNGKNIEEKYPEKISLERYIRKTSIYNNNKTKVKDFHRGKSKFFNIFYHPKDWYEFLGWYITEGSICITQDKPQICICQSPEKNIEYYKDICDLFNRMDIPFGVCGKTFYFTSSMFSDFIKDNIGAGSYNKQIPEEVFNEDFPNELRMVLFKSLMKGDGHKNGRRFSTTSEKLKNQFEMLCFLLGIKCKSRVEINGGFSIYRIDIRENPNVTVKNYNISDEFCENEDCYCITTDKNKTVFAGRNNSFNWVGQCDSFDLEKTKVVGALIRKFVEAKHNKEPEVIVWGTGKARRELIYSKDAAKGIVEVLKHYDETSLPINLGSSIDYTIGSIAEKIKEVSGYTGKITFDTSKPDGQMRKILDIGRMQKYLPDYFPDTPLKTAIKETVQWYEENYPHAQSV